MSKSKKKSTKKSVPQTGAPAPAERAEEVLTPSQRVAREDLGDFAGITMDDGPRDGKGSEPPAAPDDEVVLAVAEDRTRLLLQGLAYLLLALGGLFLVAGGIGATQISQNVAYLVLVLVGLPVAWFASRAMGRRFRKLVARLDVIDFGEHGVRINERADAKRATFVPYGDIKGYKLIRQGRALRLLLAGDWVSHPSGYQLVDINRPFMAATLDGLEEQILEVLRAHHVKQAKK